MMSFVIMITKYYDVLLMFPSFMHPLVQQRSEREWWGGGERAREAGEMEFKKNTLILKDSSDRSIWT